MDALNSNRVLCSDGGEHAHPVAAQQGDGFQISLNPRSSPGIRPSDGQYSLHFPTLTKVKGNKKAVTPTMVLRLSIRLLLPFAGITQTGSEGLPALKGKDSQPNELP